MTFRSLIAAAIAPLFAALLAGPAHADVLIENVDGIRIDEDGDLDRNLLVCTTVTS